MTDPGRRGGICRGGSIDEGATGGKGCGRLRPRWSEHFHSGASGGGIRDGDRNLILASDSLLDNSIEEVEEEPINRGLDKGVVVETGAARSCDDVSLNREEVFGVEMLKILEMSFKAN